VRERARILNSRRIEKRPSAGEERRLRVQERKGHAEGRAAEGGRVRSEKKESPGGSVARLCEIKTRFTGSFYCGYGVPFVSLWTRATVPFNRFNKYIVAQWPRWEYRASSFFFSQQLSPPASLLSALLSVRLFLKSPHLPPPRPSWRNKRNTLNGLYNFMPPRDRQSSLSLFYKEWTDFPLLLISAVSR